MSHLKEVVAPKVVSVYESISYPMSGTGDPHSTKEGKREIKCDTNNQISLFRKVFKILTICELRALFGFITEH